MHDSMSDTVAHTSSVLTHGTIELCGAALTPNSRQFPQSHRERSDMTRLTYAV